MIRRRKISYHRKPSLFSEKVIRAFIKFLRIFPDLFFKNRYGHRAVFIETIAAIPGMVGGALLHFKCLRKIKNDEGWIRSLVDEAENERMHLMTFIEIAKPNWFERALIYIIQFGFIIFYSIFYIASSRLAHRFVGYLEEEAIQSYTEYLDQIEKGNIENIKAPEIGIQYWKLNKNAKLRDLVIAVRDDECRHRDANHHLSDLILSKKLKL